MMFRTYDSWKADDYNPNMLEEVWGSVEEDEEEEPQEEFPRVTVASHSDLLRIREYLVRRMERRQQ